MSPQPFVAAAAALLELECSATTAVALWQCSQCHRAAAARQTRQREVLPVADLPPAELIFSSLCMQSACTRCITNIKLSITGHQRPAGSW